MTRSQKHTLLTIVIAAALFIFALLRSKRAVSAKDLRCRTRTFLGVINAVMRAGCVK